MTAKGSGSARNACPKGRFTGGRRKALTMHACWPSTSCSFCSGTAIPAMPVWRRRGKKLIPVDNIAYVPVLIMLRTPHGNADSLPRPHGHGGRHCSYQAAHRRSSGGQPAGPVPEAVRSLAMGAAQRGAPGHGVPRIDAGPRPGRAYHPASPQAAQSQSPPRSQTTGPCRDRSDAPGRNGVGPSAPHVPGRSAGRPWRPCSTV